MEVPAIDVHYVILGMGAVVFGAVACLTLLEAMAFYARTFTRRAVRIQRALWAYQYSLVALHPPRSRLLLALVLGSHLLAVSWFTARHFYEFYDLNSVSDWIAVHLVVLFLLSLRMAFPLAEAVALVSSYWSSWAPISGVPYWIPSAVVALWTLAPTLYRNLDAARRRGHAMRTGHVVDSPPEETETRGRATCSEVPRGRGRTRVARQRK